MIFFIQKQNTYNLRNKQPWEIRPVKSVYNGTETLSFRGPKTWDSLPNNIKKSKSLQEFTCKVPEFTAKNYHKCFNLYHDSF